MPQEVVYHSRFGHGVVKKTRYNGFELYVEFENGHCGWIRRDKLERVEESVPRRSAKSARPLFKDRQFNCRRMIEAFRLGIVPYDCIEDFTFGRDREAETLIRWLKGSDSNVLVLNGDYGVGKTHLLQWVYSYALQNGFAVAIVGVEPADAPFHKPKQLYNRLVRSFSYYSKTHGRSAFRSFMKEVQDRGGLKDHRYFKYLFQYLGYLGGIGYDEILWEWIEGSESAIRPPVDILNLYNALPGLYPYTTAVNIYCYLLSGIGWASRHVLGLEGTLLVFDEAESVDNEYFARQAEMGRNTLRALVRLAQDRPELAGSPYGAGLEYCLVGLSRDTPFSYRQPSSLKILFAFAPTKALDQIEDLKKVSKIDLKPLSKDALRKVFYRIGEIYAEAYNLKKKSFSMGDAFDRLLAERDGGTRFFVKGCVESLDLCRLTEGKGLS